MQKLIFSLRFAMRQLAKSPGFAITAVLMLAFGIGATTAIFSIVEAVLLRPLPFPDSERLMVLSDRLAGVNIDGNSEVGVTVPDIRAYTREARGFSALGGYQGAAYELSGTGEPTQVNAARLTAGVFSALGVNPLMGRVFTADEDEHSQQVAVLSYATWVSRFHRDARILGTKILLDRKPYIVIGVMPRNFEFPLNPGQLNRSELWVPMSFQPDELVPAAGANWSYQMVGRLKPGVSAEQAESDAETVAQEIMRNYPAMMSEPAHQRDGAAAAAGHDGADQAAAADAVSGRGGGAADCVREPGRADAGAGDQAATRGSGAAGAGGQRIIAAAPGDSGEPGAQCQRRSAGIGSGSGGAAGGQEHASREPAAHQRDRAELECGGVCAAAGRGDGPGVRAGSGVCGAAHQCECEPERRRQERLGGRRPRAVAVNACGGGDCDCCWCC